MFVKPARFNVLMISRPNSTPLIFALIFGLPKRLLFPPAKIATLVSATKLIATNDLLPRLGRIESRIAHIELPPRFHQLSERAWQVQQDISENLDLTRTATVRTQSLATS